MPLLWILALFSCSYALPSPGCQTDAEIYEHLFGHGKKTGENKPATNDPLEVQIGFHIQQLTQVPNSNAIHVDGFLTRKWNDAAFQFTSLQPCSEEVSLIRRKDRLWVPEISFTNGEGLIHHRHSLSFSATRNGTVTHRQRIELNIPCSSEPSEYPWGNATCQILWRSEHSQESMRLVWDDTTYGQFGTGERLVGDLRMVQVDFTAHEHQKDFSSYDELTISFTFKRSLNKTVYLFFFPSILFIGISWLSFLLGPMAITRAILVMSSFILLYLHYYFNMAGLPETSGITSLDIWKLFSLLFVFGVLVELVSVSCMASIGRSRSIQACCRSKKKKGKYEMEPLYEELNDLRQRKTSCDPALHHDCSMRWATGVFHCETCRQTVNFVDIFEKENRYLDRFELEIQNDDPYSSTEEAKMLRKRARLCKRCGITRYPKFNRLVDCLGCKGFIHLTCLSANEQMTQKVNAVWKCDDCRPEAKTPTFADLGV